MQDPFHTARIEVPRLFVGRVVHSSEFSAASLAQLEAVNCSFGRAIARGIPGTLRFSNVPMNCARIQLNADSTKIIFRDGWLIIEVADSGELDTQLINANGERLLTVAEVSKRTGFTTGAVREWIKRSLLSASKLGKEYRVRESDLAKLLDGESSETASLSRKIGRRRKAISA